jgi:hypothetical protein
MLNIDHKNYPDFVFAQIASYLTISEAMALHTATGDVIVRHKDRQNKTYKNNLLHSYDDQPAVIDGNRRNGLLKKNTYNLIIWLKYVF